MKKFLFFLFCLTVLSFNKPIKAAQIDGGQIHWVCIGTGKYIFYMELFRDCRSDIFPFTDQYLKVAGASIDSILLKPDSARYHWYGRGNISPKGPSGCQKECNSDYPFFSDSGSRQFLPFISDPIRLSGIPPSTGWVFSWSTCCRDSSQANLAINSNLSDPLKAIMYPYKNKSADTCYDSSPAFMDLSSPIVSIGTAYNFNHTAYDTDLDSLVFSFDSIFSANANTYAVPWETGYTTASPFPGPHQDARNTAVSLDSRSGHISGLIYSSNSIGKDYAYSLKVDAYREGSKISTIWRNAVFSTKAQDTLNTGQIDETPIVKINGLKTNNYYMTAYVGDLINIPIELIDSNTYLRESNDSTLSAQYINLQAEGMLFSKDFKNPHDCNLPGIDPCATLDPSLKRNPRTGVEDINRPDSLKIDFNWQVSCNALNTYEESKLHTFVFTYLDDYCPPENHQASLNVEVKMHVPEIIRNGNVLSVQNAFGRFSWFLNDSMLYNDSSSISIQGPGKYSVEVDSYCYKKVHYSVYSVGIKEKQWMADLKVYPNPFEKNFTIELPATISKEAKLILRDMSGRQIPFEAVFEENRIVFEGSDQLPSGIYFLNITMGDRSNFRKLIKF